VPVAAIPRAPLEEAIRRQPAPTASAATAISARDPVRRFDPAAIIPASYHATPLPVIVMAADRMIVAVHVHLNAPMIVAGPREQATGGERGEDADG
jgi:hypothetical protein